MKIDFDEEKHEYSVGGVVIPSVSDILSPLSEGRYKDINPAILEQAAARGTAVHEACELIDYGAEPEEDPETDGYVYAYETFLMEHEVEWELIEGTVAFYRGLPFSDGELPVYCGTVDRYGKLDGLNAVVDIKTYASMTSDAQISASCQTQLYKDAIYSTHGQPETPTRRFVLHLRKDGTYRLIDLDRFDIDRGFASHDVAWNLYSIHHALIEARKKKGKKN